MTRKTHNPVERCRQKIERKNELIAKWTAEAERHDYSDPVGRATKRYYLGRARAAQEEKEQLEAQLAALAPTLS